MQTERLPGSAFIVVRTGQAPLSLHDLRSGWSLLCGPGWIALLVAIRPRLDETAPRHPPQLANSSKHVHSELRVTLRPAGEVHTVTKSGDSSLTASQSL